MLTTVPKRRLDAKERRQKVVIAMRTKCAQEFLKRRKSGGVRSNLRREKAYGMAVMHRSLDSDEGQNSAFIISN